MAEFDPANVAEIYAREKLVLDALDHAYHNGKLDYFHFSTAWEVTTARMCALSWHLPSDEPATDLASTETSHAPK